MTTKNYLFLLPCFFVSVFLQAQDNIYAYYDTLPYTTGANSPQLVAGVQRIGVDIAGKTASWTNSASAGWALNNIGLNKNHFLYATESIGTDNFNILSYNTQSTLDPSIVKTNLNLGGVVFQDTRVQGMAIDNNGMGWSIGNSVIDGNNYAATFQSNGTGGATGFSTLSFVFKTNLARSLITDLAFDGFNNLYALVIDQGAGDIYIYYALSKELATPGATLILSKLWQITDAEAVPLNFFNPRFQNDYPIPNTNYQWFQTEGLAFDSKGNLLISVDKVNQLYQIGSGYTTKVENWLYALNLTPAIKVNRVLVQVSNVNSNSLNSCKDLASNYYPVFFPTKFGNIDATLSGGQLQVSWPTINERNNTKFDIAYTKDGINFTNIGSVNSLAPNGNSNDLVNYSFNYPATKLAGLFSIVFLLFFASALFTLLKGKRYLFLQLAMVSVIAIVSCSKNTNDAVASNEKIWIRITATDTKGITTVSGMALVKRQ